MPDGFSKAGRGDRAANPLVWIFFFLMTSVAFASTRDEDVSYSMRLWQTDDGLPHNSVSAITQTPDGYLWIGTHNGLVRFDGIRFSPIEDSEVSELCRARTTALLVGTDGTLWVGTDGYGLYQFKDLAWRRLRVSDGLPSNQILCLLEGVDGGIWIGTEAGLAEYRTGGITSYTTGQGLGDDSIRALAPSDQGTLRVATKRGLSILRRTQRTARPLPPAAKSLPFKTVTFPGGWNLNALRAIRQDRRGIVWAGSAGGLHRLESGFDHNTPGANKAASRLYTTHDGLPDNVVNCVFEDAAGQLWVGTYGGLARVVDERIIPRSGAGGPFGEMVNTLFEDREGNLWAGCRDGLYRLTPARFSTFGTEQGLSGNNVVSVCEDNSSTGIWVGIWGGGVNFLEPNPTNGASKNWVYALPKVTVYQDTNMLRDSVLALCQSAHGDLWIGMDFADGMSCLTSAFDRLRALPSDAGISTSERSASHLYRRIPFPLPVSLIHAPIRVIHEDRQGWMWVGTRSGLNRLKKTTEGWSIETYGTTNGLAANSIEAICEDRAGTIWVGTEGGLSRWMGQKFESIAAHEGTPRTAVTALYADADQTLWMGTRTDGLRRLRQGKLTRYTTREGLFSDEIYEIIEDDFGYFWMSCRRGIFRVAKRNFDELDRGQRQSVACTAFGKADGLVSVQCEGVAKPAGWKARDGRLWFPTIRGVVCVEARLPTNDRPPPVAIEEVWADSVRVRHTAAFRTLRVPPGRGELEVRYTALSLQAPEKNLFRYRLQGADSRWVEAGTARVAHYNNLAPGPYQFQVIACNNDGRWNETGAVLALVLKPHYWQTWWFKTALAALVLLLAGLAYRLRIARLREIERLRVGIAANLHDDVGARLTKVAMITEQVDQQTGPTDRLKPQVRSIAQTTREIIQAMDEIVWTINPRNDTLDHLANYLFRYAQEYFQDTKVRCRLDLPAQLPDRPISTKLRHNLFMAIKEALNNVLKHSSATDVRISLRLEGPIILFSIADNGRGFDPVQRRSVGEGLRNMEQRLAEIGGHLLLHSAPGEGTTIQLKVAAG